jgi:hypothetical protein
MLSEAEEKAKKRHKISVDELDKIPAVVRS